MASYEILNGLNYPPRGDATAGEVRREVGDVVDDLPPGDIAWLLADGLVRELAPPEKQERGRKPPPPPQAAGDTNGA